MERLSSSTFSRYAIIKDFCNETVATGFLSRDLFAEIDLHVSF
jgi:hypothetical protein